MKEKELNYYCELAYGFLENPMIPYAAAKKIIAGFFTEDVLDYKKSKSKIITRLTLIDSYYSTNINRYNLYAFDELYEAI